MVPATAADQAAISSTLSGPRMTTYLAAAGGSLSRAVDLYGWNARVSASFMLPAHLAEVATRNAVDDVLTQVYGPQWPWESTFRHSLPAGGGHVYNARKDLQRTGAAQPTTGKVIAELKFVFWQKMFTARNDVRLWQPHLLSQFPNATTTDITVLRQQIFDDLEVIRRLRNRIAHHEPIFSRNLSDDLAKTLALVHLRSAPLAAWLNGMEQVSALLTARP